MRFRIAFRTTRERRSREPVKTLFHSIHVRPWASARQGSIGRVQGAAWPWLRAYPRKPACVRQRAQRFIATVTQPALSA